MSAVHEVISASGGARPNGHVEVRLFDSAAEEIFLTAVDTSSAVGAEHAVVILTPSQAREVASVLQSAAAEAASPRDESDEK